MDQSLVSTESSSKLNGSSKGFSQKLITIPIQGNLQESLNLMNEQQINDNLLQLNLVSMYNESILQKMYEWSKQTKFYLRNRYILEKLINMNCAKKVGKKSMKEIIQKYDTVYVNGIVKQNAKEKQILKQGYNKQLRAQLISCREQFTALLDGLSINLKQKSKTMCSEDLQAYYLTQLAKINNCQIHAIISPNKLQLVKQSSVTSSQQSEQIQAEQISEASTPKKQAKNIFSICFKGELHTVKQITVQSCKFLNTKNRCPLILDFDFNKFIFKSDEQVSHQIIAMHLMKYINKIICLGSHCSQQIIQYQIIPEAHGAFYEFIQNALTINQIKKKYKGGIPEYLDALQNQNLQNSQIKLSKVRKRFAETFAGFCITQYLLDLKDRNNSNIMIKNDGSIFHIDLAFVFNASPGGWSFESCPFKFTKQYLDAMGGFESDCFKYYQTLMMSNMTKLCMNRDQYMFKLNILSSRKQQIACFKKFKIENYNSKIPKKQNYVKQLIEKLIGDSYDNWRTKKYDDYQFNTNQILP